MTDKSYEERVMEFEAARSIAMDSYFNARPQLFRTREQECLFEAGFRMAWEYKLITSKEGLWMLKKQ